MKIVRFRYTDILGDLGNGYANGMFGIYIDRDVGLKADRIIFYPIRINLYSKIEDRLRLEIKRIQNDNALLD